MYRHPKCTHTEDESLILWLRIPGYIPSAEPGDAPPTRRRLENLEMLDHDIKDEVMARQVERGYNAFWPEYLYPEFIRDDDQDHAVNDLKWRALLRELDGRFRYGPEEDEPCPSEARLLNLESILIGFEFDATCRDLARPYRTELPRCERCDELAVRDVDEFLPERFFQCCLGWFTEDGEVADACKVLCVCCHDDLFPRDPWLCGCCAGEMVYDDDFEIICEPCEAIYATYYEEDTEPEYEDLTDDDRNSMFPAGDGPGVW